MQLLDDLNSTLFSSYKMQSSSNNNKSKATWSSINIKFLKKSI